MTMKHTPGPWKLARNEWNLRAAPWSEAIGIEYDDAENRQQVVPGVVAWVTRGGDSETNARLIAAAPDLLAALEGLKFYLDHHEGWQDDHPEFPLAAEAAIKKATTP